MSAGLVEAAVRSKSGVQSQRCGPEAGATRLLEGSGNTKGVRRLLATSLITASEAISTGDSVIRPRPSGVTA